MDVPHVLVIGGGIGGLTLAHGLRRAGIPVRVFERTHERTDWLQGYRIHINPHGARALHACLPAANWAAFTAAVSPGGGFGFLTDRGRDLLALADDEINPPGAGPADRHHGIGRIQLREALLDGLGDALEPGREFTSYELDGAHVVARFADGSSARGAVLVGADGAGSRVRAQLLPHAAERIDTGVRTIAGRCLAVRDLPPALSGRANVVIPRGPGSLFTAAWSADGGEQVLWGFSDAARRFPGDLEQLGAEALLKLVGERLRGWAPEFRRLVAASEPASVNAFRVRSAVPVRMPPRPPRGTPTLKAHPTPRREFSTTPPPEPGLWTTPCVTLLGDAVHSMTPMAGVGANTALRDADLLRRSLIGASTGETSLPAAIGRYEQEMLRYGFAAVRLSLRNARQAANSTVLGRAGFRTVLRLTAAVPALRRRFARDLGN
ncbi:FAD-dependent oxidoreductase [Actinoplanes sp. URMC 104]|uniref:FAD-dependent oxidoreductase n=1 Tax=Actinoplanes sp. URMC 104 TaxID=3423409 RepID=UPI003F1B946D